MISLQKKVYVTLFIEEINDVLVLYKLSSWILGSSQQLYVLGIYTFQHCLVVWKKFQSLRCLNFLFNIDVNEEKSEHSQINNIVLKYYKPHKKIKPGIWNWIIDTHHPRRVE